MTNAAEAVRAPGQALTLVWQLASLITVLTVLVVAIPPAWITNGVAGKLVFLCWFAVMIGLATWFLRLRGLSWADVGLSRPNWLRFALAIPLGLVATMVAVGVVGAMLARAGLPSADYSAFASVRGNLGQYLFFLIPVTWGTAAFGEELLMRGFVLDALARLLAGAGPRAAAVLAVVLQAVIFGAVHLYQGVGGAVLAGTTGLMLGFVWLFAGRNLWAGILLHGLIDSAAMTMVFLGPPRG